MAKLRAYGPYPDTDNALGRTDYLNNRFSELAVTTADVTTAMNAAKAPLALKTYIDGQDALYSTKAYVDSQDSQLMNASQLGATNGIAKLSSAGKVTAPTPLRNAAGARSHHFTYSTVRTGLTGAVFCTSMTVPYPGFPWLPIWTGWTQSYWQSGATCWGGVSIRHSDGSWVARGYARPRYLDERMPITICATTDRPQGTAYTSAVTFSLYYERTWGDGTFAVGESSSWFTCLVLPASTSMSPVVIG